MSDWFNDLFIKEAKTALYRSRDGGITMEIDPTVPAWAKESEPPTYTAADVGALPVDAIKVSASGAMVSVTDAAAHPAVGLVSQIVAVQEGDGDPSPDNVRPISGWDAIKLHRAGKNLIDASKWQTRTSYGVTFANNGDGSITITGTNTRNIVINHPITITFPVAMGQYVSSGCGSKSDAAYVVFTNRDDDGILRYPSGNTMINVTYWQQISAVIQVAAGATVDITLRPMLEVGTSETTYEPYTGQTLTADLPETVYGGKLDWRTGVLTVTHGMQLYSGAEEWEYTEAYFKIKKPGYMHAENERVKHICSHYICKSFAYVSSNNAICSTLNQKALIMKDTRYTTVEEWKTYLSEQAAAGTPLTIAYMILNPYTIQLTPQQLDMLKGANTVWSDCGSTDLVYVADLQMYIDDKINESNSAILSMGSNV